MAAEEKKTELLVGLFVFCGLVLLGVLILQFSRIGDLFREKYPITVTFSDASNLSKAAPVRLGGATIGRVSEKPVLDDNLLVNVPLSIYREFNIPQGSTFKIGKDGLMGDTLIVITPPPKGSSAGFIPEGEVIGGDVGAGLEELQSSAEEIAGQTMDILKEIKVALGDLNHAIGTFDKEILAKENIENFNNALKTLNGSLSKFDTKVLSDTNTSNIEGALKGFKESSEKLSGQIERLGPVLDKASGAFDQIDPTLAEFRTTAAGFTKTADKATAFIDEIQSNKGLLDALLKDEKLREDFVNLIANLEETGILRYKNSEKREAATKEEEKKFNWPFRKGPR